MPFRSSSIPSLYKGLCSSLWFLRQPNFGFSDRLDFRELVLFHYLGGTASFSCEIGIEPSLALFQVFLMLRITVVDGEVHSNVFCCFCCDASAHLLFCLQAPQRPSGSYAKLFFYLVFGAVASG